MKTVTVTLQIGNSDDKLTQQQWAHFVSMVDEVVKKWCQELHFFGAPSNHVEWQNAAWVFSCWPENSERIKAKVAEHRTFFLQDSVAWTEGKTELV